MVIFGFLLAIIGDFLTTPLPHCFLQRKLQDDSGNFLTLPYPASTSYTGSSQSCHGRWHGALSGAELISAQGIDTIWVQAPYKLLPDCLIIYNKILLRREKLRPAAFRP